MLLLKLWCGRRSALVLVLCLAFSAQARAGDKGAAYTIQKIVFEGETPYSQAALEATAGLKAGQSLDDGGLQAAAERLMATGAFGDVGATLSGPMKSVDVIFKLQAAARSHMLRASFDNVVWFPHEELVSELQRRVPMFNGFVPEGGNVQEAVRVAVEEMLAGKGVAAKVSSELSGPGPGQPFRMVEYRLQSPGVRIRRLTISGAPTQFAQATEKVVHTLEGSEYNDGLGGGLTERILADYRNAGYMEAALTGVTTAIVSSSPAQVQVDVAGTVRTGEPYRVSKLVWAGSPQMSVEAFNSDAKLHAGDIASLQRLNETLEELDSAYRRLGYMDVMVEAVPKLDAAAHEVGFTFTTVAGSQYRLRGMTVLNLSAAQKREFDSAWKLHAGDVYNSGYVTSFLKNNSALLSLTNYSASFKISEDPEAGLLDLDITFHRSAAK